MHGLGDVVEMTSDRSYEFEVALSFAGEDRSLASKLANILRRRGVKVFFDEYEKAIQLDPNYFSAHKGRGNVLYELKRYKDALAAYNRAIQLNPKDADVYVRKGETLKHILADQKNAKQSRRKSANSVSTDSKQ